MMKSIGSSLGFKSPTFIIQIRRTGPTKEKNRKGGLGLYYHIDMNGGPANDRWVNTTTIPKLREQLNLAYQTGIDRICPQLLSQNNNVTSSGTVRPAS